MSALFYFIAWALLIVVMMRFGCGSHVMGHRHGQHSSSTDQGSRSTVTQKVPPEQDIDPVCGMTVVTRNAKSTVLDGIVYYFCSPDCRTKFEAAPGNFVGRERKIVQSEHHHG